MNQPSQNEAPGRVVATPAPQLHEQDAAFETIALLARRERIATAALGGLLAASGADDRSAQNAEAYATRAVRYADALLDALNRAHLQGAAHARHR